MNLVKGQSRVVIENVQPQVDGGLYPAKRTVGERVEITADIFSHTDPKTHKPLVDSILDAAGQKGTGRWTVVSSLELIFIKILL